MPTRLLFLSNRPGGAQDRNYDIYEADLDGSRVERVTDLPGHSIRWFDRNPIDGALVVAASSAGDLTVGPSGRHGGAPGGAEQFIAVVENGGFRHLVDIRAPAMNPRGFNGVWHPTFSPDGRRVVYSAHRQGESANLWIQNADGSGLRRLVDDPKRTYQDPRFAPDGRIVYVRHDRQGAGQLTDPNGFDVWVMNPDDPAIATPVTDEGAIPGPAKIETDPAMSPDCRWVASIRATEPLGLGSLIRPASDNVVFPVPGTGGGMRVLQQGANPLRVHGVPTWLDPQTLLSYRWEPAAGGWRVVRFGLGAADGDVAVLDLEAPAGSEDLMPLAY